MTTLGLEVGVFMVLGVEISAQVIVVLKEEVGLANANPEELGMLAEQIVNLLVTVCIDIGETAIGRVLLLIDSCREQSHIVECIRIVDADKETVEATHRQTAIASRLAWTTSGNIMGR